MKTASQVITEQSVHGVQVAYRAPFFLDALDKAGFAIVPKEPGEQLRGRLFGLGMPIETYKKLIGYAAALGDEQTAPTCPDHPTGRLVDDDGRQICEACGRR